jgi:hypothetical protein
MLSLTLAAALLLSTFGAATVTTSTGTGNTAPVNGQEQPPQSDNDAGSHIIDIG